MSQSAATTSCAVPVCITASHLLGLPWIHWGRLIQPHGVLFRDTQVTLSQAVNRMGNSEAVAAPGLIEGENYISLCARFVNNVITFRAKGAIAPDIALHSVPCTMCSVANCQSQVLLTFLRTQIFFSVNFIYMLGARWKDSKSNMTLVCLEKGPKSHMAWNDGQSLHLLSSPWPPVGRADIQSGEERGRCKSAVYFMPGELGPWRAQAVVYAVHDMQGNYIFEDMGSLTSNWRQP